MSELKTTIRTGKLFECGDYSDKNFSLSPDELKSATANFSPVYFTIEHKSSPFDGLLGQLQKVWVSEAGTEMFGEWLEPEPVTQLLKDAVRRVSVEFCRQTKRICGISLVNFPRISEAAMFAAFSRDAQFRAENEVDFTQVDLALREAGLPPATRPRANPITADGIDLDQVDAALASFKAW
jgi:hypothetical protein